jgi:hypothetical protein
MLAAPVILSEGGLGGCKDLKMRGLGLERRFAHSKILRRASLLRMTSS